MSDIFWSTLPATIAAFGALLVAGAGVWISLRTERKTDAIKKATDGMTTKMVDSAHAEGKIEGKALEQAQPTTVSVPITGAGRRRSDQ